MIVQKLDPTGRVLETIDLNDCFVNREPYYRYKIINEDGSFMLTEDSCYQIGWRISDDIEILPDNDNFKFG